MNESNHKMLNNPLGGGKTSDLQRVVGLDLLRVLLALLIFMFHSNIHFNCTYFIFTDFVEVGAIAMTGFFVLSGYSLRLVYGEKNLLNKLEIKNFYVKRMCGILPLYYTLALLYIIFLGKESLKANIILFPIEFLGLQSTFSSLWGFTHNDGTWFVSCLILGYIIYPFLQTVIKILTSKQKALLMTLLIFIDLWAVIVCHKFHISRTYDNPFYRVIEFFIGIIVADLYLTVEKNKFLELLRSKTMLLITFVFMLLGVSFVRHQFGFGDYMIYNWIVLPCLCVMLFALGHIKFSSLGSSRVLSYASKISYAFFIAQAFVWMASSQVINMIGYNHNWLRILVSFIICTMISVILYELVQNRLVSKIKNRVLS